jgi:chromatin remodeling complex protein RSC6
MVNQAMATPAVSTEPKKTVRKVKKADVVQEPSALKLKTPAKEEARPAATPAAPAAPARRPRKTQEEPSVVAESKPEETVDETTTTSRVAFDELIEKLVEVNDKRRQVNKEELSLIKELKKAYKIDLRESSRKKKKPPNPNRKPSGFHKPGQVSDEMLIFVGREPGSLAARTDITKELIAYIKSKGLQDEKDGRILHLNPELNKLLGNPKVEGMEAGTIRYFQLQKYCNHHYPPKKDRQVQEQSAEV